MCDWGVPHSIDPAVLAVCWRHRQYLFHVPFHIYTDHGALEQLAKVGEQNPRVQRWLEFLTAYQYTVKHRPGKTNGTADLLSRLPLPPTAVDFSPACRLTEPDEPGVYPIRRFSTPIYALDLQCPEIGMHMGGPRPLSPDAVLEGPAPTAADFTDFRIFGPRANISASTPPIVHLISDNTRSR